MDDSRVPGWGGAVVIIGSIIEVAGQLLVSQPVSQPPLIQIIHITRSRASPVVIYNLSR